MLKRKAVNVLTVIAIAASLNRYAEAAYDDTDFANFLKKYERRDKRKDILQTDRFVMVATSKQELRNSCIEMLKTGTSVNEETDKFQQNYNLIYVGPDSRLTTTYQTRIGLTQDGIIELNTTWSPEVSKQGYHEYRGIGCYLVQQLYENGHVGDIFAFADVNYHDSNFVGNCRETLCPLINNYSGECVQTACRRQ